MPTTTTAAPNFVSSFKFGQHVYFLFREIALETINCGKQIYSRIARVCLGDSGGQTRSNRDRWTTFAKVRLNCSIPGDFPFYFDEIQASTSVVMSAGQPNPHTGNPNEQEDLVYAVFTTPLNSIGGSAVCAYRMRDIQAAFEGPFKSQADSNSNWLPVPESRVPSAPRPGTCVNDTRRLPDENINFIKENPLMDQAVAPVWSQPLITMASLNFRFTQIQVDPQVENAQVVGGAAMRTDVIFVATDDGRVFKLINTYHLMAATNRASAQPAQLAPSPYYSQQPPVGFGPMSSPFAAPQTSGPQQQQQQPEPTVDVSSNTIVIEELHLFDSRTPIINMLLHYPSHPLERPKLIVVAGKQLKAIPVSRCERATTCNDCLALYDPYCAWDVHLAVCSSLGRSAAPPAETNLINTANWRQHPKFAGVPARLVSGTNHPGWFPPNSAIANTQASLFFGQANNHTLGWWSTCAAAAPPTNSLLEPQQQVGAPYRSLFSSHLQVPSRFDYQSGHHLSHTSLISLGQSASSPRLPTSECLTFCGGVYGPGQQVASASSSSGSNCADYVQQHYIGANSFLQSTPNLIGGQLGGQANLYTSENLYLAVIICAISGLVLGLLFGFAIGKTSSKRDSSICSSTFDETNLYMASTGSHHGGPNGGLFATQHQARTMHHQHPLLSHPSMATNGYQLTGNGMRPTGGAGLIGGGGGVGPASLYDTANQCLLTDTNTYGNQQQHQQQMLLTLAASNHQVSSPIQPNVATTGRSLPPIPKQQQQPLVSAPATHINQCQLTPPSSSSSSSTASSSDSSKQRAENGALTSDQLYLNQQQQVHPTSKHPMNHLHQRSFTNSSTKSTNSTDKMQLQQLQQQQPNNKIYL